jgi:hypothetical protein
MTLALKRLGLLLLVPVATARGQNCARAAGIFYEFQVDRPAAYAGDTAILPRPAETRSQLTRDALLIQFVVDSLGRPVVSSLRVLGRRDSAAVARLNAVVERWRFVPAMAGGCTVSQLVQTPIVDTLHR